MYISPFTTSRTFTVRLLPPRLPGRMSGSTWLHSSSVTSLGYRSLLRSYRPRFSIVHIGDLSTTQAAILASQPLDPIQYAPEQALRPPHPRLSPRAISKWSRRIGLRLRLPCPARHVAVSGVVREGLAEPRGVVRGEPGEPPG